MTTQLPGAGAILGGDFRIERQLGAGGMGAVYVAEQISTGRRRALKLMHPSLVSDVKLRERFEQEARVGARIPSDHVVQVIAAGVDEATGSPFIAMELLDGEDLAAALSKRGAFSPSDVQAILQPVCHALGAAHAAGIVHRDLKPENIFLLHTRDVQRSFDVKLLDFGIAKLTADARTMATSAMGTPLWMAPEQTDPRAKIAPTADVWPLGLLVFTMLTGRPFWRVASDGSASMQALMREILFESVDAPSVRAVELQIDVPLPVGFDAWFLKCLDRDPARRFPTANEAWEALVPVLGAELRAPAQLAVLATPAGGAAERSQLEMAATAPVGKTQLEMAATAAGTGLSGIEATVDASTLASLGGHSTGLSVGQTVSTAVPAPRSNLRMVGALAAAALVAAVSWQVATSRAERQNAQAKQEHLENESSGLPPKPPNLPGVDLSPPPPLPPTPQVIPNEPLPSSSGQTPPKTPETPKPAPPSKPKLPPFDSEAAQRSVENLSRNAKFICGRLPGPRSFGVTVTFAPSGKAISAKANVFVVQPTTSCVQGMVAGASVSPYDPAMGNVSTSVAINLD
ncbi:MAG TPA: serine/threonine-protein kinase [Polyangium sp.]|nr:serine/threonine-protein kinase [Polyangium sp.]